MLLTCVCKRAALVGARQHVSFALVRRSTCAAVNASLTRPSLPLPPLLRFSSLYTPHRLSSSSNSHPNQSAADSSSTLKDGTAQLGKARGGDGRSPEPKMTSQPTQRGVGGGAGFSGRSSTSTSSTTSTSTTNSSSSRHTKDRLPRCDKSGLTLCFSQGMTDYCWKEVPGATPGVRAPSILHRETAVNRIRLFGMPKGFPDTTAEGFQTFFYLSQTSAFVSNFASSIGFQSLLSGFFLGSSPQLWMLKDLIPALLAAYMANRVVSYENRPKFWFCVSVFMTNVTVISDMIIPSAVPNHLLAAAIVTSTVKQSASLMYFVTRAAALQHYAINNNLAELTKKFNSFGIVNYTVATALGIVYCSYIPSFTAQLTTVVACCVTNMYLSSKSMTPITFRLLNFGTMYMLLRAYLKEAGRIMTPHEISELFGVRMSPSHALKEAGVEEDPATELIYISPPVDKLLIRSDTLDDDVLYLNENRMFMLAMWRPAPIPMTWRDCWQRHELPTLPKLLRSRGWRRVNPRVTAVDKKFGGHRLCLLVHHKCTAQDLVTAYLIMYSAVLLHAGSEAELRAFVRQCHSDQATWHKEGEAFRVALGKANWDVKLPALDHHNYRMSELIVPPCMRAGGGGGGGVVSASSTAKATVV